MDETLLDALDTGTLVVARDARLARQLRWQYSRRRRRAGDEAWTSPRVATFEGWTRTLAEDVLWSGYSSARGPRSLLSNAQENALWEQIVATSGESGLLNVAATARSARDAWNLVQRWRLPDPGRSEHAAAECRVFSRWMRAYHERCQSAAWLDGARLLDTLTPAVRAGAARVADAVLFAGFRRFDPQQRTFLKALERTGARLDMHRPADATHEARRVGFDGVEAEIEAVAAWVRTRMSTGSDQRIGVVVPDLDAVRPRLERVLDEVLLPGSILPGVFPDSRPYHIAGGVPLGECPVVAGALNVIALSRERVPLDAVAAVLRSPFCVAATGEGSQRAAFDAWLRKEGFWEIEPARLAELSERYRQARDDAGRGEALHTGFRLFSTAEVLNRRSADAASWARFFRTLLDAFGWPGDAALSPRETATAEAFRELLAEFAGLDAIRISLTPEAAHERLVRLAGETRFRYRAGDAPVQVMDPSRAAGLAFDHLWIAGMDDESWPPEPQPNPFLPIDWQRDRAIPGATADVVLTDARAATAQMLTGSEEVVVSWASLRDDRSLAVSPLFAALPTIDAASLPQPGSGVGWSCEGVDAPLETLTDETGPPLSGIERVVGGTRLFELQAACPFRAFGELRLGAEPLEEPQPGLNALHRGTLLHLGLEYIWNRLGSHDVLDVALSGEHLEMQVWEVADTALAVFRRRRAAGISQRLAELERQRLIRLIMQWLRHERDRAPFEVLGSEEERHLSLGGVDVRLRIDRIDRIRGHGLAIIDYKSGAQSTPRAFFTARPDKPQLPLYALTATEPLAAVAFAQVRTGESRFVGIANNDGLVPGVRTLGATRAAKDECTDWDELPAYWRSVLENLAAGFASGDARVDPKSVAQTCRYCHLPALCRVAEQGQLRPDDTDE